MISCTWIPLFKWHRDTLQTEGFRITDTPKFLSRSPRSLTTTVVMRAQLSEVQVKREEVLPDYLLGEANGTPRHLQRNNSKLDIILLPSKNYQTCALTFIQPPKLSSDLSSFHPISQDSIPSQGFRFHPILGFTPFHAFHPIFIRWPGPRDHRATLKHGREAVGALTHQPVFAGSELVRKTQGNEPISGARCVPIGGIYLRWTSVLLSWIVP